MRTAFAHAWALEITTSTPVIGRRSLQAAGMSGSSHS